MLAGATAATATALAGCVGDLIGAVSDPVTESFSEDYTVSGETRVLISNRNGDVSVQPSETEALTVSGEKQAASQNGLDSMSVDIVEGERFLINVRFESGSDFSNRRVTLSVGLPEGVAVDAAHTANGDVTVTGVRGDLNAGTANGNVAVTDVAGFVRGETTNGNVQIRNCTGVTGARTSNGNVDVELLAMRSDVTCASSNGNVTARVGPDVSAAVRLSTNIGTAQIQDLPVSTDVDRQGYIVGSLRDGTEPLLFLNTNNGDVTLRPV